MSTDLEKAQDAAMGTLIAFKALPQDRRETAILTALAHLVFLLPKSDAIVLAKAVPDAGRVITALCRMWDAELAAFAKPPAGSA